MSEVTIESLAINERFCLDFYDKSTFLQSVVSTHTLDMLRKHMDGHLSFDPGEVEVDVEAGALAGLFEIVAGQWRSLGVAKPHFSVLSNPEWLPAQLTPQKLAEFYATGAEDVALLRQICQRNGIELPVQGRCVELGCGVGRVTTHLAAQFRELVAVDISPGNLRECVQALQACGQGHVQMVQIAAPDDVKALGPMDLLFSRMVLQHNPPPVQRFMLEALLFQLRPGGIACFQTITAGRNYRFSVERHALRHKTVDFELHALPMQRVLSLIEAAGCRLVDVFRDLAGGYNVDSYTFLAVRR